MEHGSERVERPASRGGASGAPQRRARAWGRPPGLSRPVTGWPSRRRVLQGAGVAAGLAAAGSCVRAGGGAAQGGLFVPELFLVDRITFGLEERALQEITARGYMGYLDWQLDPFAIDDSEAEERLLGVEFVMPDWAIEDGLPFNPAAMSLVKGKTGAEIAGIYLNEERGDVAATLSAADVVFLGAWSERQLLQVVGDFWMNVFNVHAFQKLLHVYWLPLLDQVVRPLALGTFGDLLLAVAKSPAMMVYLDQYTSKQENPIENFARELLELYTLGEGNFSEDEVVAAAKILTGWSIHSLETVADNFPNAVFYDCLDDGTPGFLGPEDAGEFVYVKADHDFSVKTVQGIAYGGPEQNPGDPCEGRSEGEQLIADLALHPQTADTLVRRMIQWFLYDAAPPQPLVDRVVDAYLGSGGDIAATLRELLRDDTSAGLTEVYGGPAAKVRRPLNRLIWQLRVQAGTLPSPGTYTAGWTDDLQRQGQAPTTWPSPDGHPGDNAAWTATVLPRLDAAARVAFDDGIGPITSAARLAALFGSASPDGYAAALNGTLFLGTLPEDEVQAAQDYLDLLLAASPSIAPEQLRREALAMVFSLPSAQYLH